MDPVIDRVTHRRPHTPRPVDSPRRWWRAAPHRHGDRRILVRASHAEDPYPRAMLTTGPHGPSTTCASPDQLISRPGRPARPGRGDARRDRVVARHERADPRRAPPVVVRRRPRRGVVVARRRRDRVARLDGGSRSRRRRCSAPSSRRRSMRPATDGRSLDRGRRSGRRPPFSSISASNHTTSASRSSSGDRRRRRATLAEPLLREGYRIRPWPAPTRSRPASTCIAPPSRPRR